MKANVLKGSTNNLQWRIPLTPSIVEKDHYTTSHRDYNIYPPPILGMLFLRRRHPSRHTRPEQPSRSEKFREVFDWCQGQFEWFEGRISEWFNRNSELTPPNEEQGSMDNIGPSIGYNPYYSGYQTSGIEDSANHEDGNVDWHHKMNSPSNIYWTTHSFPTKISPWTQGGSMSYYGDNDHKEKMY
ncbi:hypothetical protein PIB30_057684 [Stylosanthes scabra]|uniref:Uncharacterized protein n=1 Tax=Stylosanthes scabra TaxID=79078 RepID=A0ABU6TJK3_9FABA|nr:hypothetical protein [Stylosanthes scabra]